MSVCILTACDQRYASIADITLPLMKIYAERHGYGVEIGRYREDPDDLINWGDRYKWALYQSWSSLYDVIMWLDIDVLVMNHDIRIEDVLGPDPNSPYVGDLREFLWTYDYSGPCSGFWIASTTPAVMMLCNKIRDAGQIGRSCVVRAETHPARTVVQFEPYGRSDQDIMRELMTIPPHSFVLGGANCVSLKEAGHCFDFRALNVPPEYDYLGNYEPGDWLYTVPSLPLPERTRLLAQKAVEFYDALPTLSDAHRHHRDIAAALGRGERCDSQPSAQPGHPLNDGTNAAACEPAAADA